MRRIVTPDEIEKNAEKGQFKVTREMIITPYAQEFALSKKIQLIYPERKTLSPSEVKNQVKEKVSADDRLIETITEEVMRVLNLGESPKAQPAQPVATSKEPDLLPSSLSPTIYEYAKYKDGEIKRNLERAIVTSTGKNKPGIAAELTKVIADFGGDIQDISQTIVGEFFTMIFVVNIHPVLERGITFQDFQNAVTEAAHKIGVEAFVMHENIMKAMHRV